MPFPGGGADKAGNRYEALWTVRCLLQILKGEAQNITLELLGNEWQGVEFKLETNNTFEYHQVKRQNGSDGRWTIADLAGKSVLSTAKSVISSDDSVIFKFISQDSVANLPELNHRASETGSYDKFKVAINPKDHTEAFNKFVDYWAVPEEQAFGYLSRFYCETISENQLREFIKAIAATLIEGNIEAIIATLRVYCETHLHQSLTSTSIWTYLRGAGFKPIAWGQDDNVLLNIERRNDTYAQSGKNLLINKAVISRTEIVQSIQTSLNNGCKHIAIIGDAGSGKSVVLQSVFTICRTEAKPVFGFRLDRVNATQSPRELGQQLGLPDSPVYILAQIANTAPCILFIDQLDAVSLTSGRHPDFFNCIEDIIQQAQAFPNMQLIFGCRAFDLKHDHRFRQLFEKKDEKQAQTINVTHLAKEQVDAALLQAGFEPNRLTLKQQALLRLPLHLAIFIESFAPEDTYSFTAPHQLYEKFAMRKKADIQERTNKTIAWAVILDTLAQAMSERQELSAPKLVLRNVEDDAKCLVSAGVLIFDNERYGFFHEGFFDYCFANWFLAQNETIITFLCKSEQHLFRRAQLRQILSLLREQDPQRYHQELAQLLSASNIRLHLKSSVLAWLGKVADPQNEELDIILPIISGNDESLQNCLWIGLGDELAWFDLFDQSGLLKRWMNSDEERWINLAQWRLRATLQINGDKVADIVLPYCQQSDDWAQWLIAMLQQHLPKNSKKLFDWFLRLLKEGKLDSARGAVAVNSDFWSLAYNLEKEQPEWTCELIGAWLSRQVALCRLDPEHYQLSDSQFAQNLFNVAKTHSLCFYQQVFPPMLELIELKLKKDESACQMDSIWYFRLFNYTLSMSSLLLSAMEIALCSIAANDKDSFKTIFNQLKDYPYETVQFLLIRALKNGGEAFSDMAIDYLLTDNCKLRIGWLDSTDWASRELIAVATAFCSEAQLAKLEAALLSYYTDFETSARSYQPRNCQWSNSFGYRQFTVLSGIDKNRQSLAVKKRLQEWQRKFGKDVPEPPQGIRGGIVPSPIKKQAIERMTDAHWLQALARYDSSDYFPDRIGGAHQLSIDLESQTKLQPERFARLALAFPKDTHHYYFNAVIRGLNEATIDLTLLTEFCCYCHGLPKKPCGHALPRLIAKNRERALPESLLDMALWYALHDPDPDNSRSVGNDIRFEAINCVRGTAVGAIAELMFANRRYADYFLPFVEQLVYDPSVIVRSEVFLVVIAVMNDDYNKANQLFRDLLASDDFLWSTRWVEEYLYYAMQEQFVFVKDILESFLKSENDAVNRVGARQVCVASLNNQAAKTLAEYCLNSSKHMRLSAAEVFAANVTIDVYRAICTERLTQLFNDEDKEVRDKAASCFWNIKDEDVSNYQLLIDAFIGSDAVENAPSSLISLLEQAVNRLSDTVIELIERYIKKQGPKHHHVFYEINGLLSRLYAQSKDPAIQSRCLNVIDSMVGDGVVGLNSELLLFDR